MDGDDVRRGGPAVHALLARRFGSERIGAATAILAGDLGAALATEALSRVDVPPARLPRVLSAFAQMQSDAIAGQQLDVLGGADIEKTYELKTGSYTVAGPLRMGALLAGGSEHLIAGLERIALPAGVAFQLRDDLLSAFGTQEETGKPFANDIRSGKRTLLVECARGLSNPKERQALESAFGNAKASPAELVRAVQVLEDCGARAVVEARVAELRQRALDSVPALRLSETRSRLLTGAIEALTDRRN
jgi:geranylgeranyl diphosphate synthase type I